MLNDVLAVRQFQIAEGQGVITMTAAQRPHRADHRRVQVVAVFPAVKFLAVTVQGCLLLGVQDGAQIDAGGLRGQFRQAAADQFKAEALGFAAQFPEHNFARVSAAVQALPALIKLA